MIFLQPVIIDLTSDIDEENGCSSPFSPHSDMSSPAPVEGISQVQHSDINTCSKPDNYSDDDEVVMSMSGTAFKTCFQCETACCNVVPPLTIQDKS